MSSLPCYEILGLDRDTLYSDADYAAAYERLKAFASTKSWLMPEELAALAKAQALLPSEDDDSEAEEEKAGQQDEAKLKAARKTIERLQGEGTKRQTAYVGDIDAAYATLSNTRQRKAYMENWEEFNQREWAWAEDEDSAGPLTHLVAVSKEQQKKASEAAWKTAESTHDRRAHNKGKDKGRRDRDKRSGGGGGGYE